jgi:tetratricopeptide (TPR) repeat protein
MNELVAALRVLERVEELPLEPLSRRETAVLAERFTGSPLDAHRAERLFAETEGNPLFVVETLRAGASSPRVQAVIETRLAQLSPGARTLAGVAAVIGREFTADVLGRAAALDESALVHGLDELWRRRIVRDRGIDAYDFTHDRIREVCYQSLAPAERRHAHLQVARTLVAMGAEEPAQVALQYDRAGAVDEASAWYERAADHALGMRADAEAVGALERALALARAPKRRLELTTAIVAPLAMLAGMDSERLAEAQRRGLELARELGVEPEPPLLRSLAIARLAAGDYEAARRYGMQLRTRAERDGDEVQRVESEYALGVAAFWSVDLEAACRHFKTAISRYQPEHRATHLLRYGLDPQIICMSRLANALWFLGDPEGAIRARDHALRLAAEVAHPQSESTAFTFAALLALDAGDMDDMRRFAAALEAWNRRHESRVQAIATDAIAGFVEVLDGDRAAGLARIRRAVEASAAGNPAPGNHAANVRILLEACVMAGDWAGARAACEMPVATRLWAARTRELRSRVAVEERSRNAPAAIVPGHDR